MFGGGGGKKKPPARPRQAGKTSLSNLGLINMPGVDEFGNVSLEEGDDDDSQLEDELNNLMYGGSKANKPRKKRDIVSPDELQNMVASCMRDVPSDGEEDNVGTEDDPDLLNELGKMESQMISI